MAAASVFSESPGSEFSDVSATEHNAHYSFPFSMIRKQHGAQGIFGGVAPSSAASVAPSSRERLPRKPLQERIPPIKAMMNFVSLREEHSKRHNSGSSVGSDWSQPNGDSQSGGYPRKPPGNQKALEEGATIVWRDLTVTLRDRKGGGTKAVQGVSGYARPGTMLAIMGPPNSGNATLLQALSGKLPRTAKVYGEILRRGHNQQSRSGSYAFVQKDEELTETLSVRETLLYSALLQLPGRMPCSEKVALVDSLISDMDLEEVAACRVGKCSDRGGLSIGRRRRVSLALQLLTKPSLVFVEDPIGTLDSLSAFVVMGKLKKLANDGCTVLISLEQMSSDIFNLLDKVCLLSSGHTIFFGPATAALEHYANAGMTCPAMYNPADHLLRAINTDYDRINAPFKIGQDSEHGDMWGEMDTAVIIRTLKSAYQASGDAAVVQSMVTHLSEKEKAVALMGGGRSNPLMRLGILSWRSILNMGRDFNYYWLRLIISALLTVCVGTLGSKIGHSYASIPARVAAIFTVVSAVSLMAIAGFPSLVKDVRVHLAEREIGYSGVFTFALANLLSSAVYLTLISLVCTSVGYFLLGLQTDFKLFVYFAVNLLLCLLTVEGLMLFVAAVLPKFLEGLTAVVVIQVLMAIVAGFYQVTGDIPTPVWKYPASYLPFHGYAMEGLLQNEYENKSFSLSSTTPASSSSSFTAALRSRISGQIAIDQAYPFPVTKLGKWQILVVLAGMAVTYRLLFCLTLAISQNLRDKLRADRNR